MKKRGVFLLFFLVVVTLLFSIDLASSEESNISSNSSSISTNLNSAIDKVDKAYLCLDNKIKNNTNLLFSEAVFSMLAVGKKYNLESVIDNNKKTGEACWPKDSCKIKETAQVLLAFNRVGKNTTDIESWIKSKNATPSDLVWYIEIDLLDHQPGFCTVSYDNVEGKVAIGEDMKTTISGAISSCLSSSGYWTRIRDSCIDKTFRIQCDKDFVSTLVYQKSGRSTYYVSSDTHSGGTTDEKVGAKCLKLGSSCDYEGTLWGAVALQKAGSDITPYIPYLLALSEENNRYFPSAFLNLILGGNEHYSKIISSQKQGKYWEFNNGNKNYDSALGMLSLYGSGANELISSQNYFLSITSNDGCFGTIKDTAFLLYSGWPRDVVSTANSQTVNLDCVASGRYCSGSYECSQAQGLVSYSYNCPGFGVCCSVNPLIQSCSALSGRVCPIGQSCSGETAQTTDGSCCLGTCQEIVRPDFTCEQSSGQFCRSNCGADEEFAYGTCDYNYVCCKSSVNKKQGSSLWLWFLIGIIVLIIIIAFVLRDKIRLAWYKYKGKAKTSPISRPIGPAGMMRQPIRPIRPMMPPRQMPPNRVTRTIPSQKNLTSTNQPKREVSKKDDEMEETLRKLREMSG